MLSSPPIKLVIFAAVSKIVMMGLGQKEDIQNIYIDHLKFITQHEQEDMVAKKIRYSKEKD